MGLLDLWHHHQWLCDIGPAQPNPGGKQRPRVAYWSNFDPHRRRRQGIPSSVNLAGNSRKKDSSGGTFAVAAKLTEVGTNKDLQASLIERGV